MVPAVCCSPAACVHAHRCIQGQGLGIVVWSLAKINYDASRVRHLLQAFAQEAVHRLNSAAHSSDTSLKLGAQSLSNMLYAYALLNHHPGTQLLSAIAKGVQWQLRDFSPQVGMLSGCPTRCTPGVLVNSSLW